MQNLLSAKNDKNTEQNTIKRQKKKAQGCVHPHALLEEAEISLCAFHRVRVALSGRMRNHDDGDSGGKGDDRPATFAPQLLGIQDTRSGSSVCGGGRRKKEEFRRWQRIYLVLACALTRPIFDLWNVCRV